ncbi:MAG: HAMP domain-containing sensor histidine kinase [Spirochaetes bacterium]|jgi:signal transduction histidine kinase|nr:HAMP domain-containing sensor histidine kinase [Spirochaetota bacterium]
MIKINWPIVAIVSCFICLTAYIVVNDIHYRQSTLYREIQINTYVVYSDWHRYVGTLKGLTLTTYGFEDTLKDATFLKNRTETKIHDLKTKSNSLGYEIKEPLDSFIGSVEAGLKLGQQLVDNGYLFLDQPDLPLVYKEGRAGLSGLAGKDATTLMGPLSAYQYYQLIGRLRGMNTLFDQIFSDRLDEFLKTITERSEYVQRQFFIVKVVLLVFTIIVMSIAVIRLYTLNRSLRSLADKTSKELDTTRSHLSEVQGFLHNAQFQQSLFEMVAGLSHELNTPLGNCLSLSTYIESVLADFKTALNQGTLSREMFSREVNKGLEGSQLIHNNLEQMRIQIETFKKLSSVNHSEIKTTVPLSKYIEQNLKPFATQLLAGVKINVEGDSFNNPQLRFADLDQIFDQLFKNTAEHSTADTVTVAFFVHGKKLDIDYCDNGSQLSPETIARLAEPFYTTARDKNHMGLGLSILSSLINNKLQGTIKFIPANPGLKVSMTILLANIS